MRRIVKTIIIITLVAAIFGGIISFFTVRWIVFLGFIYLAYYQKRRLKHTRIAWTFKYYIFIALAILYNPIFQIYLYSSFLWILIDIIIVIFLLVESDPDKKHLNMYGKDWFDPNNTPPLVKTSQSTIGSKKLVMETPSLKEGSTRTGKADAHIQPSVNHSINTHKGTRPITSRSIPTSNHIIQNSKNHVPSCETKQNQSEEIVSRTDLSFHPDISQPLETVNELQQVKEIRFIHPYYPARFREHDRDFIRLKEMDKSAITKYTNDLRNYMYNNGFFHDMANTVIMVVPSHDPQKWLSGIKSVANAIINQYPFIDGTECLRRDIKVDKSTNPGADRSINKHLESISVRRKELIQNNNFIILDDITTTGNSMKACMQLVKQAGAKNIQCIAIAKTIKSVVNDKPDF